MSSVQVSRVALEPEHARSVPITAVLSGVVQVSQIVLHTAPLPVASVFTAVLGSPNTLLGQVLLGAPIPVRAADITGYGSAVGLPGEIEGGGYVIGPFIPSVGGGTEIRPQPSQRPARKPLPIHARGKVVGLRGQVEARGRVLQPVKLDVLVTGNPGVVTASAFVIQPVELALELRAPLSTCTVLGQVVSPVHARGRAIGRVPQAILRGDVIAPVLGEGLVHRQPVLVQMSGKVMWLLEREELWLVGLGSMETEEELLIGV